MVNVFEKVEDARIKKTATVETVTESTHDIPFLINQITAITQQTDEYVSRQNRAKADVIELLREAAKLGIEEAVQWDKDNPIPVEEPEPVVLPIR